MIGLSDHDEELSGDVLTTLFLNYEWRRIIAEALMLFFDQRINAIDDADIDTPRNQFQALINDLYTSDTVMTPKVAVKARRTTNQIIFTASGEVYASFDSVDFDTDAFWDSGNPTKLIVPSGLDGLYLVEGSGLNSNLAGNRTMSIWNNSSREARMQEVAEVATQGVLSVTLELVAGDEIRLSFTSSTNSSLVASANDSAWLSMVRLSE